MQIIFDKKMKWTKLNYYSSHKVNKSLGIPTWFLNRDFSMLRSLILMMKIRSRLSLGLALGLSLGRLRGLTGRDVDMNTGANAVGGWWGGRRR